MVLQGNKHFKDTKQEKWGDKKGEGGRKDVNIRQHFRHGLKKGLSQEERRPES